jgi:O-methyltransferase
MGSVAGLVATLKAAHYVAENKIEGDFVECGVWRAGHAIIAAEVFRKYGLDKKVWLFDTFSGMTEPTENDVRISDKQPALKRYIQNDRITHNNWCYAPLEEVRENFAARNLLDDTVVFIKGKVEETLLHEENRPSEISILRLDTDWYESTRFELETLYPRITSGGCLIIDDYGFWSGSRKATDEYFDQLQTKPLLHVTDGSRRIAVKI